MYMHTVVYIYIHIKRDSLVLEGHLNSNAYEKIPIGEDKVVVQNLRKLVNRHKDIA